MSKSTVRPVERGKLTQARAGAKRKVYQELILQRFTLQRGKHFVGLTGV
ncbi:MAG: hypothetical protein FWF44_03045 [Defluviitaleaceae bacterium]|nr:hypothetical protein [Defluviitaleaceae bacterium]